MKTAAITAIAIRKRITENPTTNGLSARVSELAGAATAVEEEVAGKFIVDKAVPFSGTPPDWTSKAAWAVPGWTDRAAVPAPLEVPADWGSWVTFWVPEAGMVMRFDGFIAVVYRLTATFYAANKRTG